MSLCRTGVEEAVAGHTREAPEVLVLVVGAVAPAESLEGDQVVALLEIGGDVKLGGRLRVFGVAYILSVDPKVDVGRDAAEVGDDLSAVPSLGNVYRAAVGAYMVVLDGYFGGIVLEVSAPSEADIDVLRVAVAVDLPDTGHAHGLPCAVVVAGSPETGGTLVGIGHPVEFPVALDRKVVGRGLAVAAQGSVSVLIGKEGGV